MLEGRAAIGYDYGYDTQKFYLRLALDPKYIEGFVEGCLERMGEEESEDEALFRDLWQDEGERETVLRILQAVSGPATACTESGDRTQPDVGKLLERYE